MAWLLLGPLSAWQGTVGRDGLTVRQGDRGGLQPPHVGAYLFYVTSTSTVWTPFLRTDNGHEDGIDDLVEATAIGNSCTLGTLALRGENP